MAETPTHTHTLVQQRPAAIIATITQQRQSQLQQKEQKLTNTLYLYICVWVCVCVWIYTKSFFLTTINNCIVIFLYVFYICLFSLCSLCSKYNFYFSQKWYSPANKHTHSYTPQIHTRSECKLVCGWAVWEKGNSIKPLDVWANVCYFYLFFY